MLIVLRAEVTFGYSCLSVSVRLLLLNIADCLLILQDNIKDIKSPHLLCEELTDFNVWKVTQLLAYWSL